jgi:hypothetical protein
LSPPTSPRGRFERNSLSCVAAFLAMAAPDRRWVGHYTTVQASIVLTYG